MKTPKYLLFSAVIGVILSSAGCSSVDGEDPSLADAPEGPGRDGPLLVDVPAGPGSMSSNLAVGVDGTIVLSWIEPIDQDDALRFSIWENGAWSAPRDVSRGDNWFVNWADFPSVVPLRNGLWAAHWLASQPEGGYAYDVVVSLSADEGRSWSTPFIPHTDGTPTEHGFVTLYPDGDGLGMVWLDGRKMVNEWDENDVAASGMTLRTATFGRDGSERSQQLLDDLTCDCCQTDITLTGEGPVVVYRDRTTAEIRDIYVARQENGNWLPGIAVGNDGWEIAACPVNGPVIQSDGSTVAVAWFTGAAENPRVKAAWSTDAGRTFSTPVAVDAERPLGHVGATLLPGGDLIVSWHRQDAGGGARLMLRRIPRAGDPGDPVEVELASDVFEFSVPQIVRDDDGLLLAWTVEKDREYAIRSARVPLAAL